jgi:hypothetical protein
MKRTEPSKLSWRAGLLACLAVALVLVLQPSSWGQDPLFGAEITYYVGDGPCDVAIGDFDEDGHSDVAVALQYPRTDNLAVMLGNGDGTFAYVGSYTAGNQPRGFATEDFNGDGHVDLAVTNIGSNNVSVLLGNGDGTFQNAMNFDVGLMPMEGITAEDFNEDGYPDLAVASYWSSDVSILLGNGDGTFQAAVPYAAGIYPRGVASADFNEDGSMDLVVSNTVGFGLSFLAGNGDGTFQSAVNSSLPGSPWIIGTADFDHDGHADVAIARHTLSVVSILLGNGSGTFSAPMQYSVGVGPRYAEVVDFDNDGNTDIAVSSLYEDSVSLLLGSGDGTFQYAPDDPVGVGQEPFGLAAGDFDEDGYADLVVAEQVDDSVTALLSARVVVVTSVNASVTYDGDVLVSTECEPTADVNLIATLWDEGDNVLEIDDALVTFTLEADGVGTVVVSALTEGGVAHAVEPLEPGVYTVEVTLESFDATASAQLIVYNPCGGFVTGGGWILPEDDGFNTWPDVRANFGFNAKYKMGEPRGNILFRYTDRHIKLKSKSIEQLVIAGGSVAHFMGWARVNRENGYWFCAKAVDNGQPGSGVDTFEIDIWAPGVLPEEEPTETVGGVLRGGNIKVHTKGRRGRGH